MSLETQGRGGFRKGAGRPRKKPSERQMTHSIRATEKDWKEIRRAVDIIKSCRTISKRPRVFVLSDEEHGKVSRFLVDDMIEKRTIQKYGEPKADEPPAPAETNEPKVLEHPATPSEEEAVSFFLELFRMNPDRTMSIVKWNLDKEKRILEHRKFREEQDRILGEMKDTSAALKEIDDVNNRVKEMLESGFFQPRNN